MQYETRQDKLLTANQSSRLFQELEMQTGLSSQDINNDLKEKSEILRWLVKKKVEELIKSSRDNFAIVYRAPEVVKKPDENTGEEDNNYGKNEDEYGSVGTLT